MKACRVDQESIYLSKVTHWGRDLEFQRFVICLNNQPNVFNVVIPWQVLINYYAKI